MWFKKKKKSKLYKNRDVYRVRRNRLNHIVSSGMRWKNNKHSALVYGVGQRNKRKRNYFTSFDDLMNRDKAYYDSLMKKDYRTLTRNEINWIENNAHLFDE